MRFECVLKRLDEFQRLIIVGAHVEIRAVLDQNELFDVCASMFTCLKAIDTWNKNTSDVHKRI